MKKNIHINRPEMSSEHIGAHRNFSALQQGFQPPANGGGASSTMFTKTVYLASGILVVAVSLTIWYFTRNDNMVSLATETITETIQIVGGDTITHTDSSKVVAPLTEVDIPYATYNIKAAQGGTLDYQSGTRIIVPKWAFTNSKGEIVKGDVELRYREFANPVEFFAAGIPMIYDSASIEYHFESAGMMEIAAYQNGERLNTNPQAPITVEMTSKNASGSFNMYVLNEETGEWVLKGKDVVSGGSGTTITENVTSEITLNTTTLPKLQTELKEIREEIVAIKKTEPAPPVKANPNNHRFDVDVRPEEFPEIVVYKNVFFEVSNTQAFDEEWYNITWEDVALSRMADSTQYEITFTKGSQKIKLLVYPVLEGKDYKEAKKHFDQKYASYQNKLEEKKDEERRKLLEIEERKKQMERQMIAANTEQAIVRTFSIDQFGFWNSDSPQMLPVGATIAAKFVDEKGRYLTFHHVYLAELGRNVMYTYWDKTFNRFQYDPVMTNIVWGMTTEGELAVLKPGQLHNNYRSGEKATLTMEVIKELPETMDELMAIVGYKPNSAL